SRDYDDLLESFMNNSPKVYSEDKDTLNTEENKVPSAYNLDNTNAKDSKSVKRGRIIEKKNLKKSKNKKKKEKDYSSPKYKIFRILMGILMIVGVVAVVCISVMSIYAYSVVHGDAVFDLNEQKYAQSQTSFIYGYDKNNKEVELTRLHGDENRIWVNLEDMSEYLPKAFVSIEDKRFEKHNGVDWIRTAGVIVKPQNLGKQGGSTITQQLIKNLTDEKQVTVARKFNEILSALNLERYFEKDDILEAYLNTIYLSEGCYGVKTAAEEYFGKDVKDLNIAECACIAGITQFPTKYDPLINTEENKTRQKQVLGAMLEEGAITQEQYDEAINYKLIFTNSKEYKGSQVSSNADGSKTNVIDSWYIDYVIRTVIDDLIENGYTKRKAQALVYGGGLKIYTAIDFDVQDALETVYENRKGVYEENSQSAMVVMDYKGRVLGIVGGLGKKDNVMGFNRAVDAKRQPGSAFKPLAVYAPALEKSLKDPNFDFYWSTLIKDAPTEDIKVDGKPWPTNEGGGYSSKKLTIQSGIARSLNTISARTLLQVGLDYSYNFLTERFHISSMIDQDCAPAPLATGALTNGASVLDITAAYQAFGNGGKYYYPYCYYKVTDFQGNTILESTPDTTNEQALSESTAWIMNKLLQTVMTSGTGTTYKISGVQCIGKTGTTTGSVDRYFVGGTPEYIAAVWYGFDQQKEVRQTPNPSGILWKNVMNEIYSSKGINKKEFPDYDGITRRAYDPSNGLLAKYSSGNYGWYDKNNLPGYSKSTGTTEESTTSEKNSQGTSKATSVASSTNSNVHKPQGTTANKSGSNTAE
ncbi:MAG: transglycosylase domain-containing protein, partial [Eubacterium sp.]|nr:transglycosylase domain-containing protein [Eubacterium sp.]